MSQVQILLYWIGVVAAVACLALSLTNSWWPIFAGIVSIASFLGAEFGEPNFHVLAADDRVQAFQPEA